MTRPVGPRKAPPARQPVDEAILDRLQDPEYWWAMRIPPPPALTPGVRWWTPTDYADAAYLPYRKVIHLAQRGLLFARRDRCRCYICTPEVGP